MMRIARVLIVAAGLAWVHAAVAQSKAAEPMTFKIEPQPLASALSAFSKQSGLQVIQRDEEVSTEGLVAPRLDGKLTPQQALKELLANSGLKYEFVNDRTVRISAAGAEASTSNAAGEGSKRPLGIARAQSESPQMGDKNDTSSTSPLQGEGAPKGTDEGKREEIVVTGTHIKGARPSSPVISLTREEMRLSGFNNLGEVIRALPQNFSGGQNPGVAPGADAGGLANQNITGGSSLNLRGLGADATLTLLNGTRLPFDGFSQASDISVIPVAAIEKVEVLLDGASAIYGSDAVGGVANVVLKGDYSGLELAARYGAATDGGYEQTQYTVVAGTNWSSGGVLVTGDISDQTRVRSGQRDFLDYLSDRNATIYPAARQKGALANMHQQLGPVVELELAAFYTERHMDELYDFASLGFITHSQRDASVWGIAPAIRFTLPQDWSLRIHGAMGDSDTELYQQGLDALGAETFSSFDCYCNDAKSAGLEAEGSLFMLPGGQARLSVGAGYRSNGLSTDNLLTGTTGTAGESRSRYGYGEINLPLVNPDRNIPGVVRLSLNGAFRYEDYESFGDVTTPKLGAIWSVTNSLDVKMSWGKSFKAPTLLQQNQSSTAILFPAAVLGAVGAAPDATALLISGGNADLNPERARTLTAGLVFRPQFLPGFNVELNWFDVDYTGRVLAPLTPITQALINPAFVDFVTSNPTSVQQDAAIALTDEFVNITGAAYDPAKVVGIANNLYTNVAAQDVQGMDLSARYNTEALSGDLTFHGMVSRMKSTRQLTRLAPELVAAGVIYFPAKLRGRLGASWSRGSLAIGSFVNYIGPVSDTNSNPSIDGSSMTTMDLNVDYWLASWGINLSVINVFNENPPFLQPLQPFYVNYDSTNYSPLGRVVSATLTKRF